MIVWIRTNWPTIAGVIALAAGAFALLAIMMGWTN